MTSVQTPTYRLWAPGRANTGQSSQWVPGFRAAASACAVWTGSLSCSSLGTGVPGLYSQGVTPTGTETCHCEGLGVQCCARCRGAVWGAALSHPRVGPRWPWGRDFLPSPRLMKGHAFPWPSCPLSVGSPCPGSHRLPSPPPGRPDWRLPLAHAEGHQQGCHPATEGCTPRCL